MLTRWFQGINGQLRHLPLEEVQRAEAERLFAQKLYPTRMTKAQKAASQATREKRMTQYEEVKNLYAKGTPLLTISKQLGINRQTVRAYAYADHFPELQTNLELARTNLSTAQKALAKAETDLATFREESNQDVVGEYIKAVNASRRVEP
jgi:hypothetical protein